MFLNHRKQHYDKSPNCPFFTETIEGLARDVDLQKETAVDDTVSSSGQADRWRRLLITFSFDRLMSWLICQQCGVEPRSEARGTFSRIIIIPMLIKLCG